MNQRTRTAGSVESLPRWEIFLLTALVIIGAAGAIVARRNLAALRFAHEEAAFVQSQETTRLRSENVLLQVREKELSSLNASAAAPVNEAPPVILATASRAERMASLLALARVVTHGTGGQLLRLQQSMLPSRLQAMTQAGVRSNLPEPPAFAIGPDYQLPARFGELFAIGGEEVARLQRVLTATEQRVDELTVANTTVRDLGNGSYLLEVKGLPDSEIAADRERMIGMFKEVLGDDGHRAFALLNGENESAPRGATGLTALFQSFGRDDRTITISRAERGYRYEMQFGADGRASGGGATLEQLKERLGGGIKILPPGF